MWRLGGPLKIQGTREVEVEETGQSTEVEEPILAKIFTGYG